MFLKYLSVFLISMVPLVELRGAIPFATVSLGLAYWPSLAVCVLGNLFPVPLIYFFARKVLEWGQDKRYIGKFFTRCLKKGESAGQKLSHRAGKRGMFLALLLFVISAAVFIPLVLVPYWQTGLVARFPTLIVCGFVTLAALLSLFNGMVLDAIMQQERREYEFRLMLVHDMEKRAKGN